METYDKYGPDIWTTGWISRIKITTFGIHYVTTVDTHIIVQFILTSGSSHN